MSRASVYRILEELEGLRLVARVETGQAMVRYERAHGSEGEHHHHLVCDSCGLVMPFSDEGLERAIDALSERVPLAVSEHEIVLHGACRTAPPSTPLAGAALDRQPSTPAATARARRAPFSASSASSAGGACTEVPSMFTRGRSAVEPRGDPPGALADDVEHRGQQQAADDQRVEEHGAGEAQPELLDDAVFAEHEGEEHADHDRGGGGDDAPGQREPFADGALVVSVRVHCSWMRETRKTS